MPNNFVQWVCTLALIYNVLLDIEKMAKYKPIVIFMAKLFWH